MARRIGTMAWEVWSRGEHGDDPYFVEAFQDKGEAERRILRLRASQRRSGTRPYRYELRRRRSSPRQHFGTRSRRRWWDREARGRDPRPRTRGFRVCGVGMEVQTLLFPRGRFDGHQAVAWARTHGFRASKIHETDQYLRVRHRTPTDFQPGSFRTIDLSESVRAVVGCPKRGRESDVRKRSRRDAYSSAKRLERGIRRHTNRRG